MSTKDTTAVLNIIQECQQLQNSGEKRAVDFAKMAELLLKAYLRNDVAMVTVQLYDSLSTKITMAA